MATTIDLAGHVFVRVTEADANGVRSLQALLESDAHTWAALEGTPPRADEARQLIGERPPGVPPDRKHVWLCGAEVVIDIVDGYPDASTWYLGLIFIAPGARRAGLGTRVMRALADHVRARGGTALRLAVVTTNTGARRLYDRLGFTHVARRPRALWTGDTQECDVLQLQLHTGAGVRDSREYRAIAAFYGERRAERSKVRLIEHIDEGLAILAAIGASGAAMRAFCLHPLVQADADLAANGGRLRELTDDVYVTALAIEYRHIANATLSHRVIASAEAIPLSPLAEVNAMLVADKVQNRKDFEMHHLGSHARSKELARYFRLWLERLGIDEARYVELVDVAARA